MNIELDKSRLLILNQSIGEWKRSTSWWDDKRIEYTLDNNGVEGTVKLSNYT